MLLHITRDTEKGIALFQPTGKIVADYCMLLALLGINERGTLRLQGYPQCTVARDDARTPHMP